MRNATKGLCRFHYNQFSKRVKAGLTSWELIESRGLCTNNVHRIDEAENRAIDDMLGIK